MFESDSPTFSCASLNATKKKQTFSNIKNIFARLKRHAYTHVSVDVQQILCFRLKIRSLITELLQLRLQPKNGILFKMFKLFQYLAPSNTDLDL